LAEYLIVVNKFIKAVSSIWKASEER